MRRSYPAKENSTVPFEGSLPANITWGNARTEQCSGQCSTVALQWKDLDVFLAHDASDLKCSDPHLCRIPLIEVDCYVSGRSCFWLLLKAGTVSSSPPCSVLDHMVGLAGATKDHVQEVNLSLCFRGGAACRTWPCLKPPLLRGAWMSLVTVKVATWEWGLSSRTKEAFQVLIESQGSLKSAHTHHGL